MPPFVCLQTIGGCGVRGRETPVIDPEGQLLCSAERLCLSVPCHLIDNQMPT